MKPFLSLTLLSLFLVNFANAAEAVPDKATDIVPLLNGSPLPEVQLTQPDGSKVDLKTLVGPKGAALVFYRGGWCPYCNRQLSGLKSIETDLKGLGLPLLAISPDRPEKIQRPKGESYPQLLSDSSMEVAKAFGIAFKVDENLRKKYLGYGIDLEKSSGEKHHLLPVPSVFLVNGKGEIAFSFVHPNYKVRLSPEILITSARAMLKP